MDRIQAGAWPPCLAPAQAYTYVAIWIGLSGVVIMYNKYLLAYGGFPYPITLTMWWVLRALGNSVVVVLVGLTKKTRAACTGSSLLSSLPCADRGARAGPRLGRHMFFCAALAIGLVKSGKVQAISMDRETYVR